MGECSICFLSFFSPLFIHILRHCGGGRLSPGWQQFLAAHERQTLALGGGGGNMSCSLKSFSRSRQAIAFVLLAARLPKYTNNRTCSLKSGLSISNYCVPTPSDCYCQWRVPGGACFRLCLRQFSCPSSPSVFLHSGGIYSNMADVFQYAKWFQWNRKEHEDNFLKSAAVLVISKGAWERQRNCLRTVHPSLDPAW